MNLNLTKTITKHSKTCIALGVMVTAIFIFEYIRRPKVGEPISRYEEIELRWIESIAEVEEEFHVKLPSIPLDQVRFIRYSGLRRFPMGKVWVLEVNEADKITAVHLGAM